ncbi:MAG: YtxH domain-containing protein [Nitrospiraceae bacterium]
MRDREMDYRNYSSDSAGWSAFLAGAFIGAGIALLVAPQTGSELRGLLRNYASKTTDDMLEAGREAWDTAVDRGRGYLDRGTEAVKEAGRSAQDYAERGPEEIAKAGRGAGSRGQG